MYRPRAATRRRRPPFEYITDTPDAAGVFIGAAFVRIYQYILMMPGVERIGFLVAAGVVLINCA
jgi:hypothetical protein